MTRAFLIDIYHTLALVPFADILNHSTDYHTSLASDDFVCHVCGSLASCTHDPATTTDFPERLGHLTDTCRSRIQSEPDSVDMRIERVAGRGTEVMNTYGQGIGNSKLLVEWGFIQGDFTGQGVCWELLEVIGEDIDNLHGTWRDIVDRGAVARELFPDFDVRDPDAGTDPQHEDEDLELICPPCPNDPSLLNLDQEGRISLNIWIAVIVKHLTLARRSALRVDDTLISTYRSLEGITCGQMDTPLMNRSGLLPKAIANIIQMFDTRLQSFHRPHTDVGDILNIRDVSLLNDLLWSRLMGHDGHHADGCAGARGCGSRLAHGHDHLHRRTSTLGVGSRAMGGAAGQLTDHYFSAPVSM